MPVGAVPRPFASTAWPVLALLTLHLGARGGGRAIVNADRLHADEGGCIMRRHAVSGFVLTAGVCCAGRAGGCVRSCLLGGRSPWGYSYRLRLDMAHCRGIHAAGCSHAIHALGLLACVLAFFWLVKLAWALLISCANFEPG